MTSTDAIKRFVERHGVANVTASGLLAVYALAFAVPMAFYMMTGQLQKIVSGMNTAARLAPGVLFLTTALWGTLWITVDGGEMYPKEITRQ